MKTNQAFEILRKAGGIRAARIITEKYKKISGIKVLCMARKLKRGVPVAKIINEKWFYGLLFYTNKWTLDPRPDTETLVDAVITDHQAKGHPIRILDLGTGTGCLVSALVKNIPNTSGVAIDKSFMAVRVAIKNIRNMGIANDVRVLWRSFNSNLNIGKFDIIVSNPPYITLNDMRVTHGAMHDPRVALYAKKNGLGAYIIIAKNAKKWIKQNGKIYLEIGIDQENDVRDIFIKNGWKFLRGYKDLGGIERVLSFSL